MNISITELTINDHLKTLNDDNHLPDYIDIPFELNNGKKGNYKIKTGIDRLKKLLKQFKKTNSLFTKKANSPINRDSSSDNSIQHQASFYVDSLKGKKLLFYPLKKSMLAVSNQFRLEVLRRIVPREICFSGKYPTDIAYLKALNDSAVDMGYIITEYTD